MRGRPMCMAGMVFAGMIYLLLTICPIPIYNDTAFHRQQISVIGTVKQKECKDGRLILYLRNAYRSGSMNSQQKVTNTKQSNGIIVYCSNSIQGLENCPQIGSTVEVSGKKMLFEGPRNEGQVDMPRYYQIHGMDYMLVNAQIRGISKEYNYYLEHLFRIRNRMERAFENAVDQRDASVLQAMLLGDKTDIPLELKEQYQRAGLSHLLCISGLHIALLGLSLYRLLRRMLVPPLIAGSISIFLLLNFGFLTGMGTATQRAILMLILLILADILGRSYDLLSAVAFAGICSLAGEPLLIYDSGFLLSFGAVIGIGVVLPALDECVPGKGKILQSLKLSSSITLFTLPIVLYFFFQYPVYSVVLNLIFIPFMTYLLTCGLLCGVLGCVSNICGRLLGIPCHFILLVYDRGSSFCDSLPGNIAILGRPEKVSILIYYLMLAGFVFLLKKYGKRCLFRMVGILLTVTMFLVLAYHPEEEVEITMLDVGQGDATFVRCDSGFSMLVDGGSSDVQEVGKYRLEPFLKCKGLGKLDYVFVSHTDEDHISGILELMDEMDRGGVNMGTLVLPDIYDTSQQYQDLVNQALVRNITIVKMKRGDVIRSQGVTIKCLYPDQGASCEDKNACSMAMTFEYRDCKGLFTGDLEGEGEDVITSTLSNTESDQRFLFLKVAHHGSGNSTGDRFLREVRPVIALVSCGEGNTYGHPHKELLYRLEQIGSRLYITKDSGEISLTYSREGTKINTFIEK